MFRPLKVAELCPVPSITEYTNHRQNAFVFLFKWISWEDNLSQITHTNGYHEKTKYQNSPSLSPIPNISSRAFASTGNSDAAFVVQRAGSQWTPTRGSWWVLEISIQPDPLIQLIVDNIDVYSCLLLRLFHQLQSDFKLDQKTLAVQHCTRTCGVTVLSLGGGHCIIYPWFQHLLEGCSSDWAPLQECSSVAWLVMATLPFPNLIRQWTMYLEIAATEWTSMWVLYVVAVNEVSLTPSLRHSLSHRRWWERLASLRPPWPFLDSQLGWWLTRRTSSKVSRHSE